MRIASRTLHAAAVVALLCPLLAAPAEAQSQNRPNIGSVQILIREIGTRNEIARVNPGETITLPEGAKVRINLMALPTGSGNPRYPATEFTDVGRGGTRITRSSQENAAADLEIVASKNLNRVETIRYRVLEDWVPANLRTGSFSIRVSGDSVNVPGASTGGWSNNPGGAWTGTWTGDQALQLTNALYQAILMRSVDEGAAGTAEAIRRDGFEGLVRAAVGIANSEESRTRIYQDRQVSNDQRLASLYRNLLGLEPSQVARSQWESDLSRINNGQIANVVEDLLRSDRFRSRYAVATR
ncbi:MAG TPA: hypothetical protein VF789_17835 [Thermoanaerobaculia bacterium]